jgi:hypothetical protein
MERVERAQGDVGEILDEPERFDEPVVGQRHDR